MSDAVPHLIFDQVGHRTLVTKVMRREKERSLKTEYWRNNTAEAEKEIAMSKIELAWGGGSFSVLLDVRTGELMRYGSVESAEVIHQMYGGKNYYFSRSGMSGAGWIPGHVALRTVSTYRVDTAYIEAQRPEDLGFIMPGLKIIAPIDYQGAKIPHDWPVVVVKNDRMYLLHANWLGHVLRCQSDEYLEERAVAIDFLRTSTGEFERRDFKVMTHHRTSLKNLRALVGFYNSELAFQASEEEGVLMAETNRFWTRLGLKTMGDREDVFKIAQGVCRSRYTREELSTVEGLQAAAPRNVLVLHPTLYLQETHNGFDAVGLFQFDDMEMEFEEGISTEEAIHAMAGAFDDIRARLEAGARAKVDLDRENARFQEEASRSELERDQKFRELCEMNAELVITVEDSLAAGNCRPGTEDFVRRSLPGLESVKVKNLVRFISVSGVRRVLEHKLLPLSPES